MERKVFVIWNPFAGGKGKNLIQKLKNQLDGEELRYEIFDTSKSRSATRSIKTQWDDTFTDLIIVGGDGTINEAINGLEKDVPVGIIPAGTGDDFVKNVSIGTTVASQIQTAIHGKVARIDLGRCNDRKFVNGVGIGFDGQIVEDMVSKRVAFLSGHAAYYYHVLRILGGYRERKFAYSVDNQSFNKDLILLTIGNGTTFGGGFKLMPRAEIDDGLLEVCEIGKVSGLRRFLNIHKLSGGTHGSMEEVRFHQARKVVIEANENLYAHIDGERMGQPPFEITILPAALQMRMLNDL